MKKHEFLGVNTQKNTCCGLRCLLPFDNLDAATISTDDFHFVALGWCGHDKLENAARRHKLRPTGRKLRLPETLSFYGEDHDMGHTYPWRYDIDEIWEVEEVMHDA